METGTGGKSRFILFLLLFLCILIACSKTTSEPQELRIGVLVTTGVELMRSSTINVVKMMEKKLEAEGGLEVAGKRYPVGAAPRIMAQATQANP